MKKILLCICICFSSLLFAQPPIFRDFSSFNYSDANECNGNGAGDIVSWLAYFIDNGENPDDCISDYWITFYYHSDGSTSIGTSNNPNCLHDPSIDCWTVIDFNNLGCCTTPPPLLGSGGGGGSTLECFFSPSCSECATVEQWISCGSNCSSC